MQQLETVYRGSSEFQNGSAYVQQFIIKSVTGDYLVCKTLSGTTSGTEDVYVARPYLLRRTIWSGATRNGVTYTYSGDQSRAASTGGTAIVEKVTPSYQVGDVIKATANIQGTTNVTGAEWEDDNRDGRSWAKST
jgi:hypothetical protein